MKNILLALVLSISLVIPSFAEKTSDDVKVLVEEVVADNNLYGVILNNLTINSDASKKDGSKIALVYLTWDVKNSAKTTRSMLEMYSARIVGKALEQDGNINEAVLFWEVPYHATETNVAKFNYFKKNGVFYEGDKWYAPVIR